MNLNSIRKLTRKLLQDHGTVISAELIAVAVVAIVGLVAAFTSIRDSAIAELSDFAGSVQDINQSFTVNAVTSGSAVISGSAFFDATDAGDDPEDTAGTFDNGIVLTAPEDESSGVLVSSRFDAEGGDVSVTTGGPHPEGWIVWSNGQIFFNADVPEDGIYQFSSRLWGSQALGVQPNAAFAVDGTQITNFDIAPTSFATAEVYSVDVNLTAGSHQFGVFFTNDFYQPPIDRNLFVDWLNLEGPN